ncbi:MAG: hypothetical protein RR521_06830, partial [Clostridia bacterium]
MARKWLSNAAYADKKRKEKLESIVKSSAELSGGASAGIKSRADSGAHESYDAAKGRSDAFTKSKKELTDEMLRLMFDYQYVKKKDNVDPDGRLNAVHAINQAMNDMVNADKAMNRETDKIKEWETASAKRNEELAQTISQNVKSGANSSRQHFKNTAQSLAMEKLGVRQSIQSGANSSRQHFRKQQQAQDLAMERMQNEQAAKGGSAASGSYGGGGGRFGMAGAGGRFGAASGGGGGFGMAGAGGGFGASKAEAREGSERQNPWLDDSVFSPRNSPTKRRELYEGVNIERAEAHLAQLRKKNGTEDANVQALQKAIQEASAMQNESAFVEKYRGYDFNDALKRLDAANGTTNDTAKLNADIEERLRGEYEAKLNEIGQKYERGSAEYSNGYAALGTERSQREAELFQLAMNAAKEEQSAIQGEMTAAKDASALMPYLDAAKKDPRFDSYARAGKPKPLTAFEQKAKPALDKTARLNGEQSSEDKYEQFMTDYEKDVYAYTLAKQGADAAERYKAALERTINERNARYQLENAEKMASGGALPAVLANIGTVLSSPMEGLAYAGDLIKNMRGERVDVNADENIVGRVNEKIRSTTAQNIKRGVGGAGGDALAFLYQTAMSGADSALLYPMGGMGKVGKATSLALMGTRAAQSTFVDAYERSGGNQEQALLAGFYAGAAEVFFEKFSLENFIKIKQPTARMGTVKNVLKQAGVEASEETFTEISNTISDLAIMKNDSSYARMVQYYKTEGQLSDSEAKQKAQLELAKNVGLAGLGGFLMGGFRQGVSALGGQMKQLPPPQAMEDPLMHAAWEATAPRAGEQQGDALPPDALQQQGDALPPDALQQQGDAKPGE